MKSIFSLTLLCLLPLTLFGQINVTGTAGTGYYLMTEEGDTLHLRGSTPYYNTYRIALMDATQYSAETLMEVYIRSSMNERVNADFGYFDEPEYVEVPGDTLYITLPPDTVYIEQPPLEVDTVYVELPQDTVYIELPPLEVDTVYVELPADTVYVGVDTLIVRHANETQMLHGVEVEHRQNSRANHELQVDWESDAIFNDLTWRCIDQIPDAEDQLFWGFTENETMTFSQDEQPHSFGWQTNCNRHLQITLWAQSVGWGIRKDEYLDLALLDSLWREEHGDVLGQFHTDFSDYDPDEWTRTWGNLTHWVQDETLFIEITDRNIARLQWDRVPSHENIRYRVVETLHESHTTGAHVGGRHSPGLPRSSIESFIHGAGLGISYFAGGGWDNPHDFDFDWEPGDRIEYIVEIEGTIFRAKIWEHGEDEPEFFMEAEVEEFTDVPAGFFAIGSTGAGLYIIHEVEVEIW